jgi:hypothetical protein
MPSLFDPNNTSHVAADAWSDSLYQAETVFLEHSISRAQSEMDRMRNGGVGRPDDDPSSNGEQQPPDHYQKRSEILYDLLNNPERKKRSMESILGDWLRGADRRLMELANNAGHRGSYDAAYWELEQQHAIRSGILQLWWEWLRGDDGADLIASS